MEDLFKRTLTAKELQEKEEFNGGNEWIVNSIIPVGQAGLVVAPSKSFKSSMTLLMAIRIAKGEKFAGYETKQSNVLIIDNEDTEHVLHQRLGAYEDVPDNLHFVTGGVFKLDNENHMNGLYKFIKENEIKVVIFDNLKDMLTNQDTLNDMQRMNATLAMITRLKLLFGDVTFILIAHARKSVADDSLDNKAFRVRTTHALGSSAIGGWFEFALTLSPKRKKHSAYSIMSVEARNFAFDKEIYFGYVGDKFVSFTPEKKGKPLPIALEEDRTGEEMTEIVKTPQDLINEALQLFENAPDYSEKEKNRMRVLKLLEENPEAELKDKDVFKVHESAIDFINEVENEGKLTVV